MYAVIETGGKQYRVQEGDVITIEKLPVEAGSKIEFDKVLVLGEGADINVGAPYIDGAKVFGSVVENGKGQKVIIFKYKSKKDYRKKQGHRQPYTMVEITGIGKDKPAKKSAAPKAEPTETEVPTQEINEAKAPSIKSMKKDELIAFAKENNIAIDEKATKPVIIEAIEAALK
ncbi:MAG: 50S ribosomal protein L21 [Firmicutes bacterium]|nr:50S ribosomal protein L21 [Bacillota bacterium]